MRRVTIGGVTIYKRDHHKRGTIRGVTIRGVTIGRIQIDYTTSNCNGNLTLLHVIVMVINLLKF